jgi:hypothetical protein
MTFRTSARINDIDYASKVQVYAYDMDGNRVAGHLGWQQRHRADLDGVGGGNALASGGGGSTETDGTIRASQHRWPDFGSRSYHTKVQSLCRATTREVPTSDV